MTKPPSEAVGYGAVESRTDRVPAFGSAAITHEFVITECPGAGETAGIVFHRLAERLATRGAEVLSLMIYGAPAIRAEIERAMGEALGETQWPVTWVESPDSVGHAFGGLQAFAVSGPPVRRVRLAGRIVGSVFED